MIKSFKAQLGLEEEEKKKTVSEELEDAVCSLCPDLTYEQRIGGYVTCFVISFILSIGSLTRLVQLAQGEPGPFVVFYSLGNVVAIVGSLFLMGPKSQCRSMFKKTRRWATICYLSTILITIFCAFYQGIPPESRVGVIVVCVIIQWIAMLWYTISFIPYAREYVKTVCCQGCKDGCEGLTRRTR